MIDVGFFDEYDLFTQTGTINDFLHESIDYDKKKVLSYLRMCERVYSCPKEARDVISKKIISRDIAVYVKDEFRYPDFLMYYVENYNLSLPSELIESAGA